MKLINNDTDTDKYNASRRRQDEEGNHERSPRSRLARARSLRWMVTRLAWMAARLVSSKRETR